MVSILLATYNGENFIEEQLESLLNQTIDDVKIYISDDCSTDRTYEICKEYENRFKNKIFTFRLHKNSGSAKHNFLKLMREHKDDYVMLCDQDDVWLPNKIEKTISEMWEMESMYGKSTPLLVYTDLLVTDKNLNVVSKSFEHAMHADFTRTRLNNLLVQNTVTGCTALYNRALADLFVSVPDYTVMHDWWLALTASVLGKIKYVPIQTVLYRQHDANEIGAKKVRTFRYKFERLIHNSEMKMALSQTYQQAQSLLDLYGDKLTNLQIELIKNYCKIPSLNKLKRWAMALKLRTFKFGFSRKIANLMYI